MRNKKRNVSSIVLLSMLGVSMLVGCNNSPKHVYSTDWTQDEYSHWHSCEKEGHDDYIDKDGHRFDGGAVTIEPTETQNGQKTFTCTVCGYKKYEVIDKLEHVHTYDMEHYSYDENLHWHAATCIHNDQKIDVELHTFNEGVVTKENDYGVNGTKIFTCTVCGYKKEETIPALNPLETVVDFVKDEDKVNNKHIVTYNGLPVGSEGAIFTTNSDGAINIQYKVAGASDNTYTTDAPINANEYIAKVTVAGTNKYKAIEKLFNIQIKPVEITFTEPLEVPFFDGTSTSVTISRERAEELGFKDGSSMSFDVNFDSLDIGTEVKLSEENLIDYEHKENYRLINLKAKIVKIKLTIPEELTFTRNASDTDYTKVYKFSEADGIIEGYDAYIRSKSVDITNPGTYTLTPTDVEFVSPTGAVYDVTMPSKNITLTVVDDEEFYFVPTQAFAVASKGIAVSGVINRGSVSVDDEINVSDIAYGAKTYTVSQIQDENKNTLTSACKGTNCTILLTRSDYNINEFPIGNTYLYKTSSTLQEVGRVKVHGYLYTKEEGGRKSPIFNGYKPTNLETYFVKETNHDEVGTKLGFGGTFELGEEEYIAPGSTFENVYFNLAYTNYLDVGMKVNLYEASNLVGYFYVDKVHVHDYDSYYEYGHCNTCGVDNYIVVDTLDSASKYTANVIIPARETVYIKFIIGSEDTNAYTYGTINSTFGTHWTRGDGSYIPSSEYTSGFTSGEYVLRVVNNSGSSQTFTLSLTAK